ncbi:MAG TPA: FxsA family protein [Phycisphaerae bacterium]|nr:FxsA family protein [Phycisphaerales bacterium]HRX83992.1 FxsA family protein [Phycisphaerae bacterium]
MFGYLLLAFICVPIVEIWLLIRIGEVIHAGPTIALVLLTGIAGAALARREGARAWFRIQETMARGEMPGLAMVEAVLVFVAGLLLVTPGVLTDCVGLALLLPPVRAWVARKLADHFRGHLVVAGPGVSMHFGAGPVGNPGPSAPPDDIIDVEFRDVTEERKRRLTELRDETEPRP